MEKKNKDVPPICLFIYWGSNISLLESTIVIVIMIHCSFFVGSFETENLFSSLSCVMDYFIIELTINKP
jgi:hypothetical protein